MYAVKQYPFNIFYVKNRTPEINNLVVPLVNQFDGARCIGTPDIEFLTPEQEMECFETLDVGFLYRKLSCVWQQYRHHEICL
jgi:hypothetical protein